MEEPSDKRNISIEERERNFEQATSKDEKDVNDSILCSNAHESITGKRSRESEEMEISSAKKINKSEVDVVHCKELKPNNAENWTLEEKKVRKEEESHILRLFTYILNEIIEKKNVEDTDIVKSITPMKQSFMGTNFHTIDFTQWANVCAYLYRFGSHGAGFARYSTLRVIKNCEEVKNILKKPDLKIISIGSGPGNDAVGFCSALAELQYPKKFKLTLVDKFKEWEECIDLVVAALSEQNFGKATKLFQRDNVKFIQAELPGNLKKDTEYFKALKEADVIIMSKFFSSLDRSNESEIEKIIIKSLYKHMKEDAVIFVNDTLVHLEKRWECFHCLCVVPHHRNIFCEDNEKEYYESTAHAEDRFNSDDRVRSGCPVFAFVKGDYQ